VLKKIHPILRLGNIFSGKIIIHNSARKGHLRVPALCPRNWRVSASWWASEGPPWHPSDHHRSIVLRGLRCAVDWGPLCRDIPLTITAVTYWGGPLLTPPLCRETPASLTADVMFPGYVCYGYLKLFRVLLLLFYIWRFLFLASGHNKTINK